MKKCRVRKTYLLFISILSLFLLAGCGGGDNATGHWVDTVRPTVESNVPLINATNVEIDTEITATFSEEMAPATITTSTFTLQESGPPLGTVLTGDVTYSGLTATFTPGSPLAASTRYTATIKTGAKDLAGNALASNYVWIFTTSAAPDTDRPTVILTVPADDPGSLTDVPTNTIVTATFNELMDPLTIDETTFTLVDDLAAPVLGTVDYDVLNKIAVFTPDADLDTDTDYTATISSTVTDVEGNGLAGDPLLPADANDYVWDFHTGLVADSTAPEVDFTDPLNAATDVILSKKVKATFNEPMDPLTIDDTTFTLHDGVDFVDGTVTYVGLTATFSPASDLLENTTYTATITNGALDVADNALVVPAVGGLPVPNPWTFTTITGAPAGPSAVDLGTAGNFVLLSKTGISTTGVTAITGDIGVSPIDSTAITGFGLILDGSNQFSTTDPGTLVTGNVYAADYAVPTPANMTTAISDMETAFTDAAGRAVAPIIDLGAGDISGMTLAPGLYKWSTGVLITGAGVTISGGADDVWIFQISQNLTVNSSVILGGAAQAKNIFWQVDGGVGVTLGTTVDFQGIILASKAIIFNTGATMTGRALAQTAITLQANTITEP